MAGERLHPQGWTEISAVCTDPAYRGQGLATRLVSAVAAGIAERGDRVLLHAAGHEHTGHRPLPLPRVPTPAVHRIPVRDDTRVIDQKVIDQ